MLSVAREPGRISSRDLQQDIHEPFWLINHHIVTRGVRLEGTPGPIGFALCQRFVEQRIRMSAGADVGLARHLLACAGKDYRLQSRAVWFVSKLGADPFTISFVHVKETRTRSWAIQHHHS